MLVASYLKKTRSLHNFSRSRPAPTTISNINYQQRLVRKRRKSRPSTTVPTENRLRSNPSEPGELNVKSKKQTMTDPKPTAKQGKNRNDLGSGDVTAVPNPVPDTGVRLTDVHAAVYHTTTASLPAASSSATRVLTTFSPLPPLAVPIPTKSVSVGSSLTLTSSSPSILPSDVNATSTHQTSQPRRLPIPIITLLAVGAACLLLGIFIIIKVCARPRRRIHPTPSLPILNDAFSDHDDKFSPNESPVFGGKERFSPQSGSNSALWPWTQYSLPGPIIAKPTQAAGSGKVAHGESAYSYGDASVSQDTRKTNKNVYPFDGSLHAQTASSQTHVNLPCQAPLQQVQSALVRATSRLSTVSTSVYPGSPFNSQGGHDIGIAVGGPGTALTADGHQVIKRTKSKMTLQRSSNTANELGFRDPDFRHSQGTAYDGADVSSPALEEHSQFPSFSSVPIVPSLHSRAGRSRIQSTYYTPNSYPRMSTIPVASSVPSKASVDNINAFESDGLPPIHRSGSHRNHDTRPLATALSLASSSQEYAPASPQPTLYPDDSLSVRMQSKRNSKKKHLPEHNNIDGSRRTSSLGTPMMDTTALGSLMLADFGATNTSLGGYLGEVFPQTQRPDAASPTTKIDMPAIVNSSSLSNQLPSALSKKSLRSRNDDKPPRVPSPPPLPSLAQMGLEHANPQAYADYRSPTYSIYGLYESGRKSRAGD